MHSFWQAEAAAPKRLQDNFNQELPKLTCTLRNRQAAYLRQCAHRHVQIYQCSRQVAANRLRGHNPISGWGRVADSTSQVGNGKRLVSGRCVLDDDGISMSAGIAAALIDSLLWFEVGPSVADYEPKDSQGFEQVRIVPTHRPNQEPPTHHHLGRRGKADSGAASIRDSRIRS